MVNALQVTFKKWSATTGPYIITFYNQKIFDTSLPSTAQNYKAFFNELKLRRTTPTRKEEKKVLLV